MAQLALIGSENETEFSKDPTTIEQAQLRAGIAKGRLTLGTHGTLANEI